MSNELIINASLPETRIALIEDGEIQELLIERASGKGIVGNIYKGRVTRVLPGMQAAFVDIGLEKAAFLYVDDVYVHSEIWEEEEGAHAPANPLAEVSAAEGVTTIESASSPAKVGGEESAEQSTSTVESAPIADSAQEQDLVREHLADDQNLDEEDPDQDDSDGAPVEMGRDPKDGGDSSDDSAPESVPGTIGESKESQGVETKTSNEESQAGQEGGSDEEGSGEEGKGEQEAGAGPGRRRHRRGRRGGRFRRRPTGNEANPQESYPENYHEQIADQGKSDSDRSSLAEDLSVKTQADEAPPVEGEGGRPENAPQEAITERRPGGQVEERKERNEFKAQRARDRRIRSKPSIRPARSQVNIQDLLKEGQEVLVQVAKDPIATKGARLTCHISLPGRHLVCMPTIDHVGVSRRIERDDERRRLREYVERNRPRNLGFIVRTASGKQQSEKRIKQDIEYLTRLWTEIREKAASVTAPALVYEDLNVVLRAIRDWVTEEIDKVIVDSRYHYNEVLRFVSHFMPPLKNKIELYHGDIPIFDAYGISTELSRALERKVWLKSGGYIVIDQAEALVAVDVNTGRYVGKKNLEDTILKTNLEAVQEIAYQLRLRNCGGIIIIDLIDMEKDENKQRVYRALEDALAKDRARPTILKISELGLVEMTRKRTRDTIVRTLCESCTHCEGKGFVKSKQTVAYEVLREIEREGIERDVGKILVQAHPEVIDILAIDERETLDQIERKYRKVVYLQGIGDFHQEQFEVSADKRERTERSDHRPHERGSHHHSDRHRHKNRHVHADSSNASEGRNENRGEGRGEIKIRALIIPPEQKQNVAEAGAEGNRAESQDSREANPGNEGNVATIIPRNPDDSQGQIREGAPKITPVAQMGNTSQSQGQPPKPASDEFYDEEDRLAFLRAQAAQDAALARLGNNAHSEGRGERPAGGAGGGRRNNNRNNNNNRRGGKFRRGGAPNNDRNRGRNNKPYGYQSGQKWPEPSGSTEPAKGEGGGGSSDSGSTPGGGGTGTPDHSQPPA